MFLFVCGLCGCSRDLIFDRVRRVRTFVGVRLFTCLCACVWVYVCTCVCARSTDNGEGTYKCFDGTCIGVGVVGDGTLPYPTLPYPTLA